MSQAMSHLWWIIFGLFCAQDGEGKATDPGTAGGGTLSRDVVMLQRLSLSEGKSVTYWPICAMSKLSFRPNP